MCCTRCFIYTSSPSIPVREILLQTSFLTSGYGDTEKLNTSLKVMYLVIARGGLSFHPRFSGSPPAYQHHALLFPETAVSSLSMSRRESLPWRKPENFVRPQFLQDVRLGRQCGLTATDDNKHQRSWAHLPKDHPYLPGQSQCAVNHSAPCVFGSSSETEMPSFAIPAGC